MKKILVTGGTGYIGSHTVVELISSGYDPIILDNLCNSSINVLERIEKISGTSPKFIEGDVRDTNLVTKLLEEEGVRSVIHFAGLKSVFESEENPLLYLSVNVSGTISLLQAMEQASVDELVFSSSATVYSPDKNRALLEQDALGPINNYGKTKLLGEMIIQEIDRLKPKFKAVLLRYFNPVGAHPSGLIGENPLAIPNNLMPFITQVATQKREKLHVFGNDYNTRDGTGARDFLHVVDLAKAHVLSLRFLENNNGCHTFNLGTGKNTTVLELVKTFEQVNGIKIPFEIQGRRAGDSAVCFANPDKAKRELGWVATKDICQMCKDSWNWQKNNPNGYQ